MTLGAAEAGIEQYCPRCGAEPGVFCVNTQTGARRQTTHQERKPKAQEDPSCG